MYGNYTALVFGVILGSIAAGIFIGHALQISPLISSLILLNMVTFAIYGFDKQQARRGRTRIPEQTLLVLALCMASPGALLAMKHFRHKTRKGSFLFKIGCLVVLQLIILGLVYSASFAG